MDGWLVGWLACWLALKEEKTTTYLKIKKSKIIKIDRKKEIKKLNECVVYLFYLKIAAKIIFILK